MQAQRWARYWIELHRRHALKRQIVGYLEIKQVPEHVCIHKVQAVNSNSCNDRELEVLVVGLIHIADIRRGIVRVGCELCSISMLRPIQNFCLELRHLRVVAPNEVASRRKPSINNRNLPGLPVIHLPRAWQDCRQHECPLRTMHRRLGCLGSHSLYHLWRRRVYIYLSLCHR